MYISMQHMNNQETSKLVNEKKQNGGGKKVVTLKSQNAVKTQYKIENSKLLKQKKKTKKKMWKTEETMLGSIEKNVFSLQVLYDPSG